MTREEAIDILTHGFGTWGRANGKTRFGEAIKMAIEALQQTDRGTISRQAAIDVLRICYDTETITMDNGDEYINYEDAVAMIEELPSSQPTQPEPCADTVSRTAAIEAQERIMSDHPLDGYEDGRLLINALKALPSVQPTQTSVGATQGCITRQSAIERIEWWFGILQQNPDILIDAIRTAPDAQPDLCDGCDRYGASCVGEGCGKLEMPEIIRCCDCKHRDPEDKKCDCGHDIVWNLPRQDDWFCADAKRRTDERQT